MEYEKLPNWENTQGSQLIDESLCADGAQIALHKDGLVGLFISKGDVLLCALMLDPAEARELAAEILLEAASGDAMQRPKN